MNGNHLVWTQFFMRKRSFMGLWGFQLGLAVAITLMTTVSFAEDHPIWNPGLEQAAIKASGSSSAPVDIDELRDLVSNYLSMSDSHLRNRLSNAPGGASSDTAIRERAEATYNLALLFHLTKTTDYARRAAILLNRYAEVFPNWGYTVCNGFCGIWTGWYHNDFDISRHLALAYDLIAHTGVFNSIDGGAKERARNLLVRIVQADLKYPLYTFNWAYFRPLGLVIYGRVLDDPKLAHLGDWFYAKHLHELYTRDGFIAEGSYSYHRQMTARIINPIQRFYMDGYSDPPGYVHTPLDHRWDQSRIDNFDFDLLYGDAWERMAFTLRETALPNGHWPILNDTIYHGRPRANRAEESLLMGGIGHTILKGGEGEDQTQARLDFSFTVGHRHRDALHLIYFGDRTETVGGTAYRYPDRNWNTSTLSQNLVAVNGKEQKGTYYTDRTMSPYVPGLNGADPIIRPVTRKIWDSNKENIHNNILLWEPGYRNFDEVQVVEAEATDAYRGTVDRYQRTLAMVRVQDDDYYLADIFRVRGGTQYDWLLHGGHDVNTLSVDLPMSSVSGNLGKINFKKSADTSDGWEATFDYDNGVVGQLLMAGGTGTTVFEGTAPRYQYGGSQDHLVVRRTAAATEEEVFLAVHETHTGTPAVTSVEKLTFEGNPGTATGMRVTLFNGAQDYIIHTLDEGPDYPVHRVTGTDLTVRGRFAHIRIKNGEVMWMSLSQGAELHMGGNSLVSESGDYSFRGTVMSVERRESGFNENAFVVDQPLPDTAALDGKTIILTWGNGWKWGYRIERLDGNRIITTEEPGFEYDIANGPGIDSQYFPLQEHLGLESFPGPITYVIAGSAVQHGPDRYESDEIIAQIDPRSDDDAISGQNNFPASSGGRAITDGGTITGGGTISMVILFLWTCAFPLAIVYRRYAGKPHSHQD